MQLDQLKRREFIMLLGGAAAARPLAARAQQSGKVYRIGFLGVTSHAEYGDRVEAVRTGLRRLGYEGGKNIVIHYRWADGSYDRLPGLAAELEIELVNKFRRPDKRPVKDDVFKIGIESC